MDPITFLPLLKLRGHRLKGAKDANKPRDSIRYVPFASSYAGFAGVPDAKPTFGKLLYKYVGGKEADQNLPESITFMEWMNSLIQSWFDGMIDGCREVDYAEVTLAYACLFQIIASNNLNGGLVFSVACCALTNLYQLFSIDGDNIVTLVTRILPADFEREELDRLSRIAMLRLILAVDPQATLTTQSLCFDAGKVAA